MLQILIKTLLFLKLISYTKCEEKQLKLIISLFRHGARREWTEMKKSSFPDPNLGIGDLTQVGEKAHYLLGKELKKTYKDFFPKTYNKLNFEIYSSYSNRTLTSAVSQMMGLFEIGDGEEIENDIPKFYNPPFEQKIKRIENKNALPKKAQLIPNKTDMDNIIFDTAGACPKLNKLEGKTSDKKNKNYSKDFKPLYKELQDNGYSSKEWFGVDEYDFSYANLICDWIFTRKFGIKDFIISDNLLEQCSYNLYLNDFARFDDPRVLKTTNHKLLELMLEKLEMFKKNKNENIDLRAVFMSGHDDNVASFLLLLKPKNAQCLLDQYKRKFNKNYKTNGDKNECFYDMAYTSNVIIELSEKNSELFINIRFNGQYVKLSESSNEMKYEDFLNLLKENRDNEFYNNCGASFLEEPSVNNIYFIVIGILVLLTLILIIFVLILHTKYSSQRKKDRVLDNFSNDFDNLEENNINQKLV